MYKNEHRLHYMAAIWIIFIIIGFAVIQGYVKLLFICNVYVL